MAHEELKAQYEEDRKTHERPWELYQFDCHAHGWTTLDCEPGWYSNMEYRRIEPPFFPQYFSALNWRDAEKLVGKVVEFSDDPDEYGWNKGVLLELDKDFSSRFGNASDYREYIRTCPETHAHPTITLTVNGVEYNLPMPETKEPEIGTKYWIWTPTGGLNRTIWQDSVADREWLRVKIIHLEESRAQEWADWWQETVVKAVQR